MTKENIEGYDTDNDFIGQELDFESYYVEKDDLKKA